MENKIYAPELAFFVNGEWRSGGGRDAAMVVNPATGSSIAELSLANDSDLEEALWFADIGFREWRAVDVNARAAILHRAASLIRERSEQIATWLTLEQGKPFAEAQAEVMSCATVFDYFAEEAKRSYGRVLVRPSGQRAMVIKQPVGPVAVFTPWNFPVSLLSKKLAAALAAGCSVIAKPAEETPASTSAIVRCVADAGLPKNAMQLVFGVPDQVSRTLLASPIIRKVSFTGSIRVGKHLMRLAADGVKRLTMELGGHAPVLVFDDCDLEKALDILVTQKFCNAGQICVSPTRFYVQQGVYQKFVAGFAERMARCTVGDGLDPATQMGPLANLRRPAAVSALIDDAVLKGAVRHGGEDRCDHAGFFLNPTLLSDVPPEADIMSHEPFGPVALAQPFATLEEAIEKANCLPFGLASFVFTSNLQIANLASDAIEAGMVGINTVFLASPDAPFGGVKESGIGSEGGPEGLDSYFVTKAIHQA